MNKYKKKIRLFLRNEAGKVKSFSVLLLLIVAALSTVFIFNPSTSIQSVSAATVDQFSYYKEITLNSSQVPSTLTNFPVLINLPSDADLAADALDSGNDIAFFDDSNTQLNHEIELFNGTTGQLVAWVNVTTLTHDVDTTIKMYYGDADIGSSAENVVGTWDSNYMAVWHLTNMSDSTSNSNDAVDSGVDDATGFFGGCQDFEQADGDHISTSPLFDDAPSDWTIEAWVRLESSDSSIAGIMVKDNDNAEEKYNLKVYPANGTVCNQIEANNVIYKGWHDSGDKVGIGSWSYVYYQYSASDFIIGGCNKTRTRLEIVNTISAGSAEDFTIGQDSDGGGNELDGLVDEYRVSNVVRSSDWLNCTYNSLVNSFDGGFFSIGSEQKGVEGTYEISGLDSNTRFPFSGETGDTVWSTGNITMSIHTNLSDTSENCTDIFLDLVDIDADIVQESFSVAVKNHADGSWSGNTVTIPAADGNLTLNSSQWSNNWCDGTDPFPIDGTNVSIDIRMKVSIPVGKDTGTYNTDSWEVLWKVIS